MEDEEALSSMGNNEDKRRRAAESMCVSLPTQMTDSSGDLVDKLWSGRCIMS
jgi:hypothetical protein